MTSLNTPPHLQNPLGGGLSVYIPLLSHTYKKFLVSLLLLFIFGFHSYGEHSAPYFFLIQYICSMYYFIFSCNKKVNLGFVAAPTTNNATTLLQQYASVDDSTGYYEGGLVTPGSFSYGDYIDWTTVLSGTPKIYFKTLRGKEQSLQLTAITDATDIRMGAPGCGEEFFQVGKKKGMIPIYKYADDYTLSNPVYSYPFESLIYASSYTSTVLSLFFKTFRNEYDEVRINIAKDKHSSVLAKLYEHMRSKQSDIRILNTTRKSEVGFIKNVENVDSIISPSRL